MWQLAWLTACLVSVHVYMDIPRLGQLRTLEIHSFNTFKFLVYIFYWLGGQDNIYIFHQTCGQDNILDLFLVLFDKARKTGMGKRSFSPEYLLVVAVVVLVVMGTWP